MKTIELAQSNLTVMELIELAEQDTVILWYLLHSSVVQHHSIP